MRSNAGGPVSSGAIPKQLHSDELWAKIEREGLEVGMALREQLKTSGNRHLKRVRTAELDLGAGPSHWVADSEDRDHPEQSDTRRAKRKKMTVERTTEDTAAAQRGETQELRARRSSKGTNDKSKLGNQGLGGETLMAPPQGVYPSSSPRATTGATLGPTEFTGQAWTGAEGSEHISEGTEDVLEETDEERESRLMVLREGGWKCRECPGQSFHDKSTLRRHCKTVHGYDRRRCPICPYKSFARKSGLVRHLKEKHNGGV